MVYVVAHHDDGWAEADAAPRRDPLTDLPYQFTEMPRPLIVPLHALSPQLNEQHHPFCGLLASMHTWGLYHGRYGLSDKLTIDSVSPPDKPAVMAMLQGELTRQARLQAQLAADAATAAWVTDGHLFYCYQQLQFFDTISLYFCMGDPDAARPALFRRVPLAVGADVTITLRPLRRGFYSLSPYPFTTDFLEMCFAGRYLLPLQPGANPASVLEEMPEVAQTVTLVEGTEV
jgi:hypothetical protein